MGSPWRTQHSDITRGTTLTHADLDNNFIFLKGEVIDSARLDGETLKLTKICGADIELNLSALTQTNEDSLRVLSDTADENKNKFNTDVTNINTTINEFKSDVENNSVWEWVDDRKNEVKIKGSGNTDTIVYAPKLNINIEPANDNSLTQVLVRDDNGNVKYRDIKSFIDLNVVSGVYDIKSGIVTLTNNEGGSFEISGFTSGMTDSYTDEAYLKGNTIYFNNNIKGDDIYSVDISPILDDVINSVGYNDRGECSLKSYTEYESLANNYINVKNVYDELQSNKQQLEVTIADLQSQLVNAVTQEERDILNGQIQQNEKDLKRIFEQIKEIEASGDLEFIIYMPVNESNFNCWLRYEIIKSIGYDDRGECSYKMYAFYENLYQKSLKEQLEINKLESEKAQVQEIRNQEHTIYISEKNQLENDLSNKQNELEVLKQIVNPTPEEINQIVILEEQIAYIESQLKKLDTDEEQAVKSYTQHISFLDEQINSWYTDSLSADQSGYEFLQNYTPLNEANFNCWRNMFLHEIQEEQINNIITTIGYNDRGVCSLDSFTEYKSLAENYTNTKNEYDALQSYKQDLETNIADLKSQLVNAVTQEERDILNAQIKQNEEDLKQTNAQIKEIEASGDLDFVAYMPVNEVNFNCWSDSKQTESLSNEINITNNNLTEQVEIINKTINEVVENVGYNDRGVCSLDSFTEYKSLAENYTNTKNEYDVLQNSVQQLEVAIGDLQSQLVDAQSQVPVDQQLVAVLQQNIDKNQEDLKQTKVKIKEIEASGDLDFVVYIPVNESNFNCWVNSLQDNKIEDFNKGIQSNSSNIEEVNDIIDKHINETNNPHQTSFSNLTSTAHTHTISDVIGLQNDLDDINKAIQSIDDVYVNQGNVDVLNQKLIFTNTDGGTFEVTNSSALFTDNDIHVVSGVYDPSTGVVTYTTNVGTTFGVDGFTTGMTDSYTTAANLNGEIISFDNNVNGDGLYSVDLSTMLQPLKDRLG
jgi:peptidoglycan hydrolase CwlO-like protein